MITAIVQARVGSSRLPGKVLMDIGGKTMVERVLEAASNAERVDAVIAAIPDLSEDDALSFHIRDLGYDVFRGSSDDVLDRFCGAAVLSGMKSGDAVVRLTADCPLMVPEVIDQVVEAFVNNSVCYASNVRPPSYPDGLDVEVFTFDSLCAAHENAKKKSEREHVTPFIFESAVNTINVRNSEDLSDIRLTVDHADDLEFVREFVLTCGAVELSQIRTQIASIRDARSHERNEGYQKSLNEERS